MNLSIYVTIGFALFMVVMCGIACYGSIRYQERLDKYLKEYEKNLHRRR